MTILSLRALASCLACGLCSFAQAGTEGAWSGPEERGRLPAEIRESSGLAVSRRDPEIFWTHGDSGGEPVLSAITAGGRLRGRLRIADLKNIDWEDIASFELDGKTWLLVADTGDNKAGRGDCALYVVEEPDAAGLSPEADRIASVAWKIPVIYPDGPRDCEAVAVDAKESRVYLLAKRKMPHGLYALNLRPTPSGRPMPPMERLGEMPAFPPAPEAERMLPVARGLFRPQPTGMDIAADGSAAVIVTYGDVLVYPRRKDEPWAAALTRAPLRLAEHGLRQAEAVAFGANSGEIVVTSEGAEAPLIRYRRSSRKPQAMRRRVHAGER